jgi:CheY-like chemotaxis protein
MKKKILLVDDVKLFLKLEETYFKRTGCEILTACSGEEALSKTREHKPDLIVLDYIMPDMMGDEICRQIKSDEPTSQVPIIIVSTSGGSEDMERCFAAGANDYVTKPINAQDILAKAAILLKIPQRIHQRIPVNMKVAGEASGKTFTGFSRNISGGGILVECSSEIPLDSEVSLDLPILPDMNILTFSGCVVRAELDPISKMYNLGIEFLQIPPRHEQALKDFIGNPRSNA